MFLIQKLSTKIEIFSKLSHFLHYQITTNHNIEPVETASRRRPSWALLGHDFSRSSKPITSKHLFFTDSRTRVKNTVILAWKQEGPQKESPKLCVLSYEAQCELPKARFPQAVPHSASSTRPLTCSYSTTNICQIKITLKPFKRAGILFTVS